MGIIVEEFKDYLDVGGVVDDLGVLFKNAGYDLYLVGGPVRDILLKKEPKDLDFATNAKPEETKELLRPVASHLWTQGERFGTIGAEIADLAIEVTTFRAEIYEEGNRKPTVAFGDDVIEDLRRRDFRMNAMAIKFPEREFLDPFNGAADIRARNIQAVNDADRMFRDDPLRMLRAFRFTSQLGFRIPDELLFAIKRNAELLKTISHERIRDEFSKLIVAQNPARALKLADRAGILDSIMPELPALKLTQDPDTAAGARHKDIFAHTLVVLEKTPKTLELRLTALLHDSAKPECRRFEDGGVSFHGHDILGAEKARKRLKVMKYPNDVVDTVTELIRLHHRSHTFKMGWTDSAVRRYVHEVGELRPLLHAFVRADCTTKNPKRAQNLQSIMNALEKRIMDVQEKDEQATIRPEMNGHEIMQFLGLQPGPEVGNALDFLLYLRLEHGILGREEVESRLLEWAKTRELVA